MVRKSLIEKINRKMVLKSITSRTPNASLKDDVRLFAELYEIEGEKDIAEKLYIEAATGQYTGETISDLARYMSDIEDGDWARACCYFEIAYDLGSREIRSGDYLMMGSYHQFDVMEGREYGLNRDMNLARKWYLEMLKKNSNAYAHLSFAYMEKEIRDYKKAYECAMRCPEDNERGVYCAGLIHEFGLVGEVDKELAEKYFERVLELVDTDDLFYNLVVDRLAEIKGIKRIPFTVKYFESQMDRCKL